MKGIDISSYQAGLDFAATRKYEFEVCIVKATEGTEYINGSLNSQINKALNVGMKIGFYHFFRNSGLAEAQFLVNTIRPYIANMKVKPVIDIEVGFDYSQVLAFINYVESALSVPVIVYCNYSYAKRLSQNSEIAKRTLWLAYYGSNDGNYYVAPTDHGFKSYGGQQYSDQNNINGVACDMNIFNNNIFIPAKQEIVNEGIKVDYIIQYSNADDQAIAEVMADRLNCPTINSLRPYAYYGQYKTVIAVGEAKNRSSYTNVVIAGKDRKETVDLAIAYCKKLGK